MTVVDTDWELVVGLEVHAELATQTKVFCQCPNRFGDEPNTNVCPVCLGLPGSLPVLNQQVVELAIRLGAALHCDVQPSIFHRKNYFYPDMPKDYQISQYDRPINVDGWLDLPSGHRVGIVRAHLEEDTGKSTHMGAAAGGRIHGSEFSLVDYNRAGVPLLEIVSEPDIRSVDQAREYVGELRALLVATGVSDAKMEEGSMRVDANVSVRRTGATEFGTRAEIKNLNSVRSLGRAIEYEARRQIDLLEAGDTVRQETRHWDEGDGRTHTLRTKEDADDYRYFPEPDLVPLAPSKEWLAAVQASMPLLPTARRERLAEAVGRAPEDATVAVIVERDQDALVVDAVDAGGDSGRVLVHVEHDLAPADVVVPARLAALTRLEVSGALTATQAKAVLADVVAAGGDADPAAIAAAKGFEAMDTGVLEAAVDAAIAADQTAWEKYVAGDDKVAGAFVGPVMKATKGKADGKAVNALLRARRDATR
ncbi:MAG TPA: Asp-tRNA(Asn)/Glu-tRNA(Gln) amidotransferase subunit GatB [Acidimicrobiales bacterium]|nr:Asp-tRNA(Asn)/Glu-tRNA(Gln) amidotransferase subunit GatB [Acidimicrobiales bacterium]